MSRQELSFCNGLKPAQPLWKLAPTRDTDGTSFVDFMMVIPKLKKKPQKYIDRTLKEIHLENTSEVARQAPRRSRVGRRSADVGGWGAMLTAAPRSCLECR